MPAPPRVAPRRRVRGVPAWKTEKLKSWEPAGPGEGHVARFPSSHRVGPLVRRAARPRFAYTARDMGAAE